MQTKPNRWSRMLQNPDLRSLTMKMQQVSKKMIKDAAESYRLNDGEGGSRIKFR